MTGRCTRRRRSRTLRIVALCAVGILSATSCTEDDPVFEVPPPEGAVAAFEQLRLPPPVPAVASYIVKSRRPLSSDDLDAVEDLDGVAVVASVSVVRTRLRGGRGGGKTRLAGIDPEEFRPLAPPGARDAEFVWLSLLGGDVVATPKTAKRLGVAGTRNRLQAPGEDFRVGAVADNGTPNVGDVLISREDGSVTEWPAPRIAVVGAESGVPIEELGRNLRTALPRAKVSRIVPRSMVVAKFEAPSLTVVGPTIPGLHPTLAAAVGRLIGASGGRVWLVSGFRDSAQQYRLWVDALARYGDADVANNWVARPGHSMHERGLAVDLGGDLEYAAQLVTELGLPMYRPLPHEPWHFELAGSRG